MTFDVIGDDIDVITIFFLLIIGGIDQCEAIIRQYVNRASRQQEAGGILPVEIIDGMLAVDADLDRGAFAGIAL